MCIKMGEVGISMRERNYGGVPLRRELTTLRPSEPGEAADKERARIFVTHAAAASGVSQKM